MANGLDFSSLGDVWGSALNFGADPTYDQPRTALTQTGNALQTMQPITGGSNTSGFSWDWMANTANSLLQYAVVKDMFKTQASVQQQAQQAAQQQPAYDAATQAALQRQQNPLGQLMPLLLIGGVIFVIVKAVD